MIQGYSKEYVDSLIAENDEMREKITALSEVLREHGIECTADSERMIDEGGPITPTP